MAYYSNAAAEYLNITTNLPSQTNFTACGWTYWTGSPGAFPTMFAIVNSALTAGVGIQLSANITPQFLMLVGDTTTVSAGIANVKVNTQWFFWAIVGDPVLYTGYGTTGDGQSLGTAQYLNAAFTAGEMHIARMFGSGSSLAGYYLNVRIWNATLSAEEIVKEWKSGYYWPARWHSLYGWYPMQAGASVGDSIRDMSGNNNHWAVGAGGTGAVISLAPGYQGKIRKRPFDYPMDTAVAAAVQTVDMWHPMAPPPYTDRYVILPY